MHQEVVHLEAGSVAHVAPLVRPWKVVEELLQALDHVHVDVWWSVHRLHPRLGDSGFLVVVPSHHLGSHDCLQPWESSGLVEARQEVAHLLAFWSHWIQILEPFTEPCLVCIWWIEHAW